MYEDHIIWCPEPDTMRLPSGEIATDQTTPVCPRRGAPNGLPVSASQTRIVLSSEPDTMRLPSREIATLLTE